MEIGSVSSIISVTLAILVTLFGTFRYITAQVDSLRREIDTAEKNAQLQAEKVGEAEARQRHQANNTMQILTTKMEQDIRTIQREAVRHEQLSSLENRLQGGLAKIEVKVDKLAENAAEIIAIRAQLAGVGTRVERINDRLDEAAVAIKRS
jgi:vacuolar-type H+-ATPase subunit D/Vma8